MSVQVQNAMKMINKLSLSCMSWFNQLPTYQKIVASITAITGSLTCHYIYCKLHRKLYNYPPGPIGLPVIGYAPWMNQQNKKNMFGSDHEVIMVYVFGRPRVLIADMDSFKKTWKKQVHRDSGARITGHPRPFSSESVDSRWSKRRQLNHASFTSLINSDYLDTIMTALMQKTIFPEMDRASQSTEYYYCRQDIKWLGFAFFHGVLYGVDTEIPDKNDPDFHRYMDLDTQGFASMARAKLIDMMPFPVTRKLLQKYTDLWKPFGEMRSMIQRWEERAAENPKQNADTYFNRMEKNIAAKKITKKEAYSDAMVLVSAGLHVTLSAIEIAVYHCAKFPDIQQKVYQELKSHYNKYKGFEMKHMNQLQIFRAFVYESLRYGAPAKSTLTRDILTDDCKVGDYNIPKGAILSGETYFMHRNEKYFAKPNDFYLEHFLDDNGSFKKNKNFVIFGYGRRDCVGQSLAIKELFCILSAMLHRYKFSIPEGQEENFVIPWTFFQRQTPKLPLNIEQRVN